MYSIIYKDFLIVCFHDKKRCEIRTGPLVEKFRSLKGAKQFVDEHYSEQIGI